MAVTPSVTDAAHDVPLREEADRLRRQIDSLTAELADARQARMEKKELLEQARTILDTAYEAFVSIDAEGRITDWNRKAEETFGWSRREVLGLTAAETIIPARYRAAHEEGMRLYLATGHGPVLRQRVELHALHRTGREFPIEIVIWPVATSTGHQFNAFVRDITERKQAEQALADRAQELTSSNQQLQQLAADLEVLGTAERQAHLELQQAHAELQETQGRLVQSEKLAAIGLLSAGIAHEINNPLAFVGNNLVVLQRDLQGLMALLSIYDSVRDRLSALDPELRQRIEDLAARMDLPYVRDNLPRLLARTRDGVDRMTRIVENLRGMARTSRAFEEAPLADIITASLEMMRDQLQRRQIVVAIEASQCPTLRCAPTQLNQVLLNLLTNAMQAIEASERPEGGRIGVAVRTLADEALIEVADNGCGIDPNDLAQIFDPFFTTKTVGQGTGLGLSISHGIITGHGGRIEVESQPGEGSRFRVFLPLHAKRGSE